MNAPSADLELPRADVAPNDRPPRLPFVLSVGITGHRKEAIPPAAFATLRDRLAEVLETVISQAATVRDEACEFFSDEPPRLRFVSPLADGADQIAAEAALELGFELQAVLPFDREQ
ncbi:MAG TPA: hypothetical protein VFK58_03180, partial [Sphingomicrobium sp.]|nr:hypothetical protein [Sphingomicrobium sp.]